MSTTVNVSAVAENSPQPSPERFCDIVMKGGITSGVVYPPAIVELSKTYTFKNNNKEREINLQMMPTSLTHGRPYRLPFTEEGVLLRDTSSRLIRAEDVPKPLPELRVRPRI